MRLEELGPGAIVRLKSGSIKFTVEKITPLHPNTVHLIGWHERGGVQRFAIHHACLCLPYDSRSESWSQA